MVNLAIYLYQYSPTSVETKNMDIEQQNLLSEHDSRITNIALSDSNLKSTRESNGNISPKII